MCVDPIFKKTIAPLVFLCSVTAPVPAPRFVLSLLWALQDMSSQPVTWAAIFTNHQRVWPTITPKTLSLQVCGSPSLLLIFVGRDCRSQTLCSFPTCNLRRTWRTWRTWRIEHHSDAHNYMISFSFTVFLSTTFKLPTETRFMVLNISWLSDDGWIESINVKRQQVFSPVVCVSHLDAQCVTPPQLDIQTRSLAPSFSSLEVTATVGQMKHRYFIKLQIFWI